jgi:pimeloyl-ACP methyl ester carboxylesterase
LIAPKHSIQAVRIVLRLSMLPLLAVAGCLSYHRGAMPGEPRDATYADVDGVRVRYLDTGAPGDERPTVVLLHGFASSLETWTLVAPALGAHGFRVLALDLKGFGWTDRPPGDYSPQAQAKLVLELMDQRGVQQAAVVGHSWGASVALAMALGAPDRVTRLALYDAWAFEDQLPTFFLWARASGIGEILFWVWYDERADERIALAFFDKRYVTEKLIEDVDRAMNRPGTKAAALAAVRGQRYKAMQKHYPEVKQPTLLLWGREDIVTPPSYGERLSRLLPHVRMVVYPFCGHFPMIEAAAASTRDLVDFLLEEATP